MNEQFYKDAEQKLKDSGNFKSPASKNYELSKAVEKFLIKKIQEDEAKKNS
ncbi:hypothetical protein [Pseudomonas aeruginosa]|uniref:hypothetical protein n=1 Tax=Pseudomonas aeruginosa TaxID=287 RepID=UPI00163C4D1F|nr:hypothetical protein [Pseudomonas aeruginosa]MBI8760006.1 hypothetical protein [Pseudomonas aeruginosa]HEJ1837304.1 hypothetical protein [Pseudomonas aeruginosa]HEK3577557.1 hypothetical protein [Pseudomonas aeruginosa]HEK3590446.1 hypothetical protein [Pseudomonas aeruginosa]HEQ1926577.1 hypothetical protein [Pseudomonas aeruginosa]